ncbi:MAG: DinB family protein [Dehalococcoidia bacterium]
MRHQIGLITYESNVHAWVLDLTGAVTGARDVAGLGDVLPLTIAEHGAWLRSHGAEVASSGEWEIAETLDGLALAATGGEFNFAYDREPLGGDELEALIARARWSRADLMATVEGLPDTLLDWAPPASTIASFDAWAPEVRTIREIAGHVLQLETYYRDGLRDGAAKGIFEHVDDPATERARTLRRLRAMSDEERSRRWMPVRPGRTAAEEWTVRKVMRRIIAHEREHAAEVRLRLTWVLLGLPRANDHS